MGRWLKVILHPRRCENDIGSMHQVRGNLLKEKSQHCLGYQGVLGYQVRLTCSSFRYAFPTLSAQFSYVLRILILIFFATTIFIKTKAFHYLCSWIGVGGTLNNQVERSQPGAFLAYYRESGGHIACRWKFDQLDMWVLSFKWWVLPMRLTTTNFFMIL